MMNSFQPIAKIIEDLATLDDHCKAKRDNTPLLGMTESFDSNLTKDNANGGNVVAIGTGRLGAKGGNGQPRELHPFSLIDAFYAFKTRLVAKSSGVYVSLLKTLFAVETKKVQTFLYKDSMLGRFLLEKTEIKKCY
jgi:hypothetical protein